MDPQNFKKEFVRIWHKTIEYALVNKKEGILSLEGKLDEERLAARDPFESGVELLLQGSDLKFIEQILDHMEFVNCSDDKFDKILYRTAKTAVLLILEDSYSTIDVTIRSLWPRILGPFPWHSIYKGSKRIGWESEEGEKLVVHKVDQQINQDKNNDNSKPNDSGV